MPPLAATYETLSAMITPALFMTANGSLIISTSNRMSRIVDRIRGLNEQADALSRGAGEFDFRADRQAHAMKQIGHLEWRSGQIRRALTSLYIASSLFVGTSLTLAADVVLSNRIEVLPTTLAVAGAGLMLAACVNLAREARFALDSNHAEVEFYRVLRERRQSAGPERPSAPAGGSP